MFEERRHKQGAASFRRTVPGLLVGSEFTAFQKPRVPWSQYQRSEKAKRERERTGEAAISED